MKFSHAGFLGVITGLYQFLAEHQNLGKGGIKDEKPLCPSSVSPYLAQCVFMYYK